MKSVQSRWLGAVALVAIAAAVTLAIRPAWAAAAGQEEEIASPALAAMHAACTAGDADAMDGAMDSLTAEDWRSMEGHMATGDSQATHDTPMGLAARSDGIAAFGGLRTNWMGW